MFAIYHKDKGFLAYDLEHWGDAEYAYLTDCRGEACLLAGAVGAYAVTAPAWDVSEGWVVHPVGC